MGDANTKTTSVLLTVAAGIVGSSLTVAAIILAPHLYRIFRPSVIAYPWKKKMKKNESPSSSSPSNNINSNDDKNNRKIPKTVIFAASYNPPHHGHLKMLEHLSKTYLKVIAVIGFNPNKKYPVSPEERADLLREMLEPSTTNVEVEGEQIVVCT